MAEQTKKKAIWDGKIVKRAIVDSFKKLKPGLMMKNPVIFVVEVGSVLTTIHRAGSRCHKHWL
jgi:K+-transporting ATPase ATPase B chain